MNYEPTSSSPFNPNSLTVPPLASTSSSPGPSSSSPSQLSHRQTSYKSRQSLRNNGKLHDRFLDRCLSRIKSDRSAALTAARGSGYANTVYARPEGTSASTWSAEEELVMRKIIKREWEMYKRHYSDDWVEAVGYISDEEEEDMQPQPPEELDYPAQDVEMDEETFVSRVGNSECLVCRAPSSALCQTETAVTCLACHWSLSISSLVRAQEVFYRHG